MKATIAICLLVLGFGAFLIWDDYAHPPNDTVIYLWPLVVLPAMAVSVFVLICCVVIALRRCATGPRHH